MDVAVASAHRTEGRSEIGADGVQNRLAEREPSRRIADERRENIGFRKRNPDGRAQGLLAASQKNAAVNFSGTIKRGKLVIQQAGAQHEAIRGEHCVTRGRRFVRRAGINHRLKHGGILSPQPARQQ